MEYDLNAIKIGDKSNSSNNKTNSSNYKNSLNKHHSLALLSYETKTPEGNETDVKDKNMKNGYL